MNNNNKIIIGIIIVIILLFIVWIKRLEIKTYILNFLVVSRGIIAPNCLWYNISEILLNDGAGVDLYNTYKKKHGDFPLINMFGEKIYMVTNNKNIKTILDNSPDLFSVGKLKKTFFQSFMSKNVGVSQGCPWKKRRYMNEMALVTDRLHTYAEKYNNDMIKQLLLWKNKSVIVYNDLYNLGKIMVAKNCI